MTPHKLLAHYTTLKANLANLYSMDPLRACRMALSMTRTIAVVDRIEIINELLGMHGTEAIRGEWQNGYWCDIVAVYCNTGDSYKLTVIQTRQPNGNSRFIVSSMADWVIRHGRQMGVE